MPTYLGKSCSFGLPRVPFVNCRQFMYLVISLLVLRAGCGIWLYQFLNIAYLFTLICLQTKFGNLLPLPRITLLLFPHLSTSSQTPGNQDKVMHLLTDRFSLSKTTLGQFSNAVCHLPKYRPLLSFNYTNMLSCTVQTHFTHFSILLFQLTPFSTWLTGTRLTSP